MADDMDTGEAPERKSSGFKTFVLGALAAVATIAAISSGLTFGGLAFGAAALFLGSKALQSHRQNQEIDAENAAMQADRAASLSPSLQQERAAAIARMQGGSEQDAASTNWQRAEERRRTMAAQNAR